ncbi:hypothetical protein M569_02108 [Genlisea aurea]|uniref:Integral membrane bound transporter domain-containing protein n=1 Tax=Genlisea aurea TaxID=192259 RepID=S8D5E1_9LAMI|nr:hypothetical protein M569_02108 [Genlisea aurea]
MVAEAEVRARTLWSMRLSSALRTAVACGIVGGATLYGPKAISGHIKFPSLSYLVLMLFGDTLGDVLGGCRDTLCAVLQVIPAAVLGRWCLGRRELPFGAAVPLMMAAAFLVTLPAAPSLTVKRIALVLIVLMAVGVDSDDESDTTVVHVLHVAASAGFGAMASLLAFLIPFPLPALAYHRMKKLSEFYAGNACTMAKLLKKGFSSKNGTERREILLRTKPISETQAKLLQAIRVLEEESRWERAWSRRDYCSKIVGKLNNVELAMRGIEYSLTASPASPLKFDDQDGHSLSAFWADVSIQFQLHVMKQSQRFPSFFSRRGRTAADDEEETAMKVNPSLSLPLTSLSQVENHEWACFLFSCADLLIHSGVPQQESKDSDEHPGGTVADRFKSCFRWLIRGGRIETSVRCAAALGLAVVMGELIAQDDGRWAGFMAATAFADGKEPLLTAANARGQGTAIGSVFALICLHAFHQPGIKLLALIPWVIFVRFLRHSKLYGIPGGYSSGVAALMILGRDNYGSQEGFAVARLTSVFIGLACILMAEFFTRSKRASTKARKQLYVTLRILKDCIKSLQSEQHNPNHHLQQLENSIRALAKYVSDAKSEPDFWFLPFRASCYEKMIASLSTVSDMLRFVAHNSQMLRNFKQYFSVQKEFPELLYNELQKLEKMVGSLLQILDGSMNETCKDYQPIDTQKNGGELWSVILEMGTGSVKQRIFICVGAVEFCIKTCKREIRGALDVLVREIVRWENNHLNH